MAETPSKRQREETPDGSEDPKRHKSYNHILSLLEEEEDESSQDFSSILNTLERELSCDSTTFDDPFSLHGSESDPDGDNLTAGSGSAGSEEGHDETERFMRHLLEASDDELGIPNRSDGGGDDEAVDGGDALVFGDGLLWDLEDATANYITLFQSELFM